MNLSAILKGHVNEMLGLNTDLYQARIKICKTCPLYKIDLQLGEVCNSKLWYNVETGDITLQQKDGYVNGCGCRLKAKTRLLNASCPVGKW